MTEQDQVNILLVDDQPAKLLAYEVILKELNHNLIVASSGREALECLLKNEIAVILADVCMPDLDGFQLAAMIREHPRFQKTAIIFISAIQVTDFDRLRGYELGAVDYVPVPVVPEVLRAKVKVFAELYRKTSELERLNVELEERVRARTGELEASTASLRESENRRTLAIAAGNMGSWDWDWVGNNWMWDEGQYRIFGVDPETFEVTPGSVQALLHPDDIDELRKAMAAFSDGAPSYEAEFRVRRPNGEVRWCIGTAAASVNEHKQVVRVSGVTMDITERKEAEQRQTLLTQEVDHRAKNALALVQSMIRLTRAEDIQSYIEALEGRIAALARVHTVLAVSRWEGAELEALVREELAPYQMQDIEKISISGPRLLLESATAQTFALALHELATNAAKYGSLSTLQGKVGVTWRTAGNKVELIWEERGGPPASPPKTKGFGTRSVIASINSRPGGHAEFEWLPTGLRCTLVADYIQKSPVRPPDRPAQASDEKIVPLVLKGRRILVVEDEALVAMATCELLEDLGYQVVGPVGRMDEAMAVAIDKHIDGAVLDVNVGGEIVYPLADRLVALGVPFIFVTGYAPEAIQSQFSAVLVLQKPLDKTLLQRVFTPAPVGFKRPRAVSAGG